MDSPRLQAEDGNQCFGSVESRNWSCCCYRLGFYQTFGSGNRAVRKLCLGHNSSRDWSGLQLFYIYRIIIELNTFFLSICSDKAVLSFYNRLCRFKKFDNWFVYNHKLHLQTLRKELLQINIKISQMSYCIVDKNINSLLQLKKMNFLNWRKLIFWWHFRRYFRWIISYSARSYSNQC